MVTKDHIFTLNLLLHMGLILYVFDETIGRLYFITKWCDVSFISAVFYEIEKKTNYMLYVVH